MELYTIYEDTNIKIEILKILHDYFDRTTIKWIELSDTAKDFLYGEILAILKSKLKNQKIEEKLIASKAVIIESTYSIALTPPFDVFNKAVNLIELELEAQKSFEEITEDFSEIKFDEKGDYTLHFFQTPLFKINGFLSYYKNGTLLIILFNIKED